MVNNSFYKELQKKLEMWIDQNGISGWDNYDGLNSQYLNKIHNHYLRIATIQIILYSPVNFRKYLKIEKGVDIKGLSLLAHSAILLYEVTKEEQYLTRYKYYNQILFQKSLKNIEGYHSWGSHYYPYTALRSSTTSKTADIIVTSRMLIQLVEGYLLTNDDFYKDIAVDVSHFLLEKLLVEKENISYFNYYSVMHHNDITYNASAHAVEALSFYLKIEDSDRIKLTLHSVVRFLIDSQLEDGSWNHSLYPEKNKIRKQLDFHIGYMIDGLLAYLPYAHNHEDIVKSIKSAAAFYQKNLFDTGGRSFFRYPRKYPIDIHNQAQGIITFSKLSLLDKKYLEFARMILDWTIENMQDKTGYFYYQKWPLLTNKIPYMRWSEAWMMVALATYRMYSGCDEE